MTNILNVLFFKKTAYKLIINQFNWKLMILREKKTVKK